MKILHKLLLSIVVIIWILLWFYAYLGWFHKLVAFEVVMWPHTVAYVEHVGDYKLIWDKMNDLYEVLIAEDISTTMGIGIYYDDPATVVKEELKSDGGVVIDEEDISKLDLNSDKYKIQNLEKTDYAVITFPFKSKLSYIVWMMRVYPELWAYLIENKYSEEGPAIEMYDIDNNLIYYMVEVK